MRFIKKMIVLAFVLAFGGFYFFGPSDVTNKVSYTHIHTLLTP